MFPFIDGTIDTETTGKKIPQEYAWDFENNDFALKNGKPYLVEGVEAIKVWIYKTLKTIRYKYSAYSWNYGVEFEDLIGKKLSKQFIDTEIRRMIKEALMVNENIQVVTLTDWQRTDNTLKMNVSVQTDYGDVTLNV